MPTYKTTELQSGPEGRTAVSPSEVPPIERLGDEVGVMVNGLTRAETDATASVMGLVGPPAVALQLRACWGLTFMCAESGRKCAAAGRCVFAPPPNPA